jgi:hypothetical protein
MTLLCRRERKFVVFGQWFEGLINMSATRQHFHGRGVFLIV